MRNQLSFGILISILVVVFSMIFLSSQEYSIIGGGGFNDPDLWLCRNNATITNGRAHLGVNETQGSNCFFSSVQQGRYPHGWDKKDSIKEIEVRRGIEATDNVMFITIVADRSDFGFFNETESIVNVGIMMWVQLDENYDKPINETSQLELDINIASFLYGSWTNHTAVPITWDSHFKGFPSGEDNDYHYIDSTFNQMLEPNRTYEITVDAGKSIAKALSCFNIQKGKLKSFDIYIEAKCGSGEATIDYAEFIFAPKVNSGYVIFQSGFYGFLTFLVALFALMLFKKLQP